MALHLTPRLLRRGLELFALISLAGVVGLLFYGHNFQAFLSALVGLHWGCFIVGFGLPSMDCLGGRTPLLFVSGGMSAWAAYLTPFQTGAGPMMMWTMRRAGVSLPEAMTSTFMTFVATVAFFAIAGPVAITLGAGHALARFGLPLGITLYGLFQTSLGIFALLGLLMAFAMVFPRLLRDLVHRLASRLEGRNHPTAGRTAALGAW